MNQPPQKYGSIEQSSNYPGFKKKFIEENCTKCRLCEGRHRLVFDRGNPDSRILIIGEAPGREEDAAGECFVGRAGKLLDKIMASIGLDTRKDALIVNVVKCRPPDNRAPLKDEVEMCRPYLIRQIELMRPKIIILLGATACKHVFPQERVSSMARLAGSIFDVKSLFRPAEAADFLATIPSLSCMVLYHPAYLLYDPRKKDDMWRHVQHLRDYLIKNHLINPSITIQKVDQKAPF